jgi:hypothetical protein
VRLVPVGKPTFPDQQQDLQNAAESRVTSECDGSVKFLQTRLESRSGAFRLPDGVQVGLGISQVREGFCTTLAGYGKPDCRSGW